MTVTPFPAVLAAALRYATEMRWRVFPAPPGKKKSYKSKKYSSSGQRWGATKNLAEIRRDFGEWPSANVGIPTGADNGIIVIEVDTAAGHARLARHGVDGIASLKRLEDEHGPLPITLMAESPSGSIHYYFKHPRGGKIKNSSSEIADGVDVRGDGGMVIAPPSVRKDGVYRWINWGVSIADPPAWLIDLILAKSGHHGRSGDNSDVNIDELEAALMVVPNDEKIKWDNWNRIGMALWGATGGSDEGLELFQNWSAKNVETYDEDNTRKEWQGYCRSPPNQIGAGTIFYLANQASRDWRHDYEIAIWKKLCSRILAR
jgi:hypothetical protein